MRRPLVYLDTSAWNWTFDWARGRAVPRHEGVSVAVSSTNLGEFGRAPKSRSIDLANFAWTLSRGRRLRNYDDVVVDEVTAGGALGVVEYFEKELGTTQFWLRMRSGNLTTEDVDRLLDKVWRDAASHFHHLQQARDFGRRVMTERGTGPPTWGVFLSEVQARGFALESLKFFLAKELSTRRITVQQVEDFDLLGCCGTNALIEYHWALIFLAAYGSGRTSRPDDGDTDDYGQACYAGVADVFVTKDRKMYKILTEMLECTRARIMTPEEYVELVRSNATAEEFLKRAVRAT